MSIIPVKQIEMLKKDHRDGSRCRAQNCDKQLEDYLVVKAVDEVVFSGCRAVVPPPQSPHTDETSPATQTSQKPHYSLGQYTTTTALADT